MTCQHTSTLGVYLLGALEPEERSTFESHLYGCDQCRTELVRLAPLPGLLNQIAVTDFEGPLSVPELPNPDPEPAQVVDLPAAPVAVDETDEPPLEALAEEPSPRRRRWLVTAAAAAAAILLTVGGILAWGAIQGSSGSPHTVTWSAIDPVSGVHADVQLTERSWGTDIKVWMSDVPGSKECRLVVKAKYGYHDKATPYYEVAGWWTSDHRPTDDIPGATSIDLGSIYRLEIMDGDTMLVGMQPKAS